MKIILTDDRGVWLDGKERKQGYAADVSDDLGASLVASGLAEKVKATSDGRDKTSKAVKSKAT